MLRDFRDFPSFSKFYNIFINLCRFFEDVGFSAS